MTSENILQLLTLVGVCVGLWKNYTEIKSSRSDFKNYILKSKSNLTLKKIEELPELLVQFHHLITNPDTVNKELITTNSDTVNKELKESEIKLIKLKIDTLIFAYSSNEVILLYKNFNDLNIELNTPKSEDETSTLQLQSLTTFFMILSQLRYDISNASPNFSLFSITYPHYETKKNEIRSYVHKLQKKFNLINDFTNII